MKWKILLLSSCLLISCSQQKQNEEKIEKKIERVEKKDAPQQTDKVEQKVDLEKDEKKSEVPISETSKSFDTLREVNFDETQLPKALKVKGKLVSGLAWEDKLGMNYLVFSKTHAKKETSLHIHHFLLNEKGLKTLRALKDYQYCDGRFDDIDNASIDLREFAFEISDLDSDGVGEATFAYSKNCEMNSASPYSLFLLENGKKFKLKGTQKVKGGKRITGKMAPSKGSFEANDLVKSNPIFLEHLTKVWMKTRHQSKDARRFGHTAHLDKKTLRVDGKELQLPALFREHHLCPGSLRDFSFYAYDAKKSLLHISAVNCDSSLKDPLNAHVFVFVDDEGTPVLQKMLATSSFPTFTGQGEIEIPVNKKELCEGKPRKEKVPRRVQLFEFDAKEKALKKTQNRTIAATFRCP